MNYLDELSDTLSTIDEDLLQTLVEFVNHARIEGQVVYIAGNGGNFTNALHWALDLQKVNVVRTHVLGMNPGLLTAWSNDVSYQDAMTAEFDRLRSGQRALLICLSASGTSQNIESLIEYAVRMKIPSVLITGGHNRGSAFYIIRVPSENIRTIEDCIMAIGHWLVGELQK